MTPHIQYYRLQIALRGGMGFELITDWPLGLIDVEIQAARSDGRYARILHSNKELASVTFGVDDLAGFQHTPLVKQEQSPIVDPRTNMRVQ